MLFVTVLNRAPADTLHHGGGVRPRRLRDRLRPLHPVLPGGGDHRDQGAAVRLLPQLLEHHRPLRHHRLPLDAQLQHLPHVQSGDDAAGTLFSAIVRFMFMKFFWLGLTLEVSSCYEIYAM